MFADLPVFITPSFTSLMTWFVIFTNIMLIIYALECFFLIREKLVPGPPENRAGSPFTGCWPWTKARYTAEDRESDHRIVRRSLHHQPACRASCSTAPTAPFSPYCSTGRSGTAPSRPSCFILAALLSGGALITFLISVFQRDEEIVRILGRAIFLDPGSFPLAGIHPDLHRLSNRHAWPSWRAWIDRLRAPLRGHSGSSMS